MAGSGSKCSGALWLKNALQHVDSSSMTRSAWAAVGAGSHPSIGVTSTKSAMPVKNSMAEWLRRALVAAIAVAGVCPMGAPNACAAISASVDSRTNESVLRSARDGAGLLPLANKTHATHTRTIKRMDVSMCEHARFGTFVPQDQFILVLHACVLAVPF